MNQKVNGQISKRSVPYFIIIGVQKGGTTSLFSYLRQHPQLQLSVLKEIHFFDLYYSKGLDWYGSHFPLEADQVNIKIGEASPYYFFHPLAAQRISVHCPNVKLILLLRNPVDRAYSHYMMQNKRKIDPLPTFEEAFGKEEERMSGEIYRILNDPEYNSFNHQKYSYLSRGMYYQQLVEWLKYFTMDQFLFIKSEDFFMDPLKELLKVYDFLQVDSQLPLNINPENTNTYSPMAGMTRSLLYDYFKNDTRKLAELIDDDFSWKE